MVALINLLQGIWHDNFKKISKSVKIEKKNYIVMQKYYLKQNNIKSVKTTYTLNKNITIYSAAIFKNFIIDRDLNNVTQIKRIVIRIF